MSAGPHDPPKLLEQADGVVRGVAPLRQTPEAADQDMGEFIRLSLDDPAAVRLLQDAAAHLLDATRPEVMTRTILAEAMALTGAERGHVQIADPASGALRIVELEGFDQGLLDYFAFVDDATSAWGRMARLHAPTMIADVNADPEFAPLRAVAAASGFRAVLSTPLIDAGNHLVGTVSTHFPQPGTPPARTRQLTRLYGRFAGEALARCLSEQAADHPDGQHRDGRARPRPSSTVSRESLVELSDVVVRSLFSAGLSLAGAQSLIGDGVAGDKVAAAIEELDHAISGIRSAVLDLHGEGSPLEPR